MYSVEKVRKETILELDTFLKNKEDNKIVELSDKLFSLDLTMYSKNNNLKSLCYNAFALSTLDDKISLHPSQIEILNVISENKASIISAPTSFGKTFCIFEHINICYRITSRDIFGTCQVSDHIPTSSVWPRMRIVQSNLSRTLHGVFFKLIIIGKRTQIGEHGFGLIITVPVPGFASGTEIVNQFQHCPRVALAKCD